MTVGGKFPGEMQDGKAILYLVEISQTECRVPFTYIPAPRLLVASSLSFL